MIVDLWVLNGCFNPGLYIGNKITNNFRNKKFRINLISDYSTSKEDEHDYIDIVKKFLTRSGVRDTRIRTFRFVIYFF